jgi:hypothetical protein
MGYTPRDTKGHSRNPWALVGHWQGYNTPALVEHMAYAEHHALSTLLQRFACARLSQPCLIGFLRALSLSFVFPANVEHSGTLLAAIVAGGLDAHFRVIERELEGW